MRSSIKLAFCQGLLFAISMSLRSDLQQGLDLTSAPENRQTFFETFSTYGNADTFDSPGPQIQTETRQQKLLETDFVDLKSKTCLS